MRALLLAIATFLIFPAGASACSCIAPDPDAAEAVFVGKVAEVTDDRVTFDIESATKGPYAGRATFGYQVGDGANCGANLRVGERTGVLLYGDEESVGICNLFTPDEAGDPAAAWCDALGRATYFMLRLLGAV